VRHRLPALAAVAAVGVLVAPAQAAAPTIHVAPKPVQRGYRVHVFGRVPGCPTSDRVVLLSRAFRHRPGRDFAGVPTVRAKQGPHHGYSVRPRIPAGRRPGTYALTGRCGGGNIGALAHIKVVR
jgi:hypothetical protein